MAGNDAGPLHRLTAARRAGALVAGSAGLAAFLEAIGLPAALLLGPLIVAVVMASTGRSVTIPPNAFRAGQAIVGILIATSITPGLLRTVAAQPLLFAGTTAATLAASIAIGWALDRWRLFPPGVAVWGSMPGAATSMVLMARDGGADWRLVASMSYLRVVCVAAVASLLAAVVAGHGGGHPSAEWFPPLDPPGLAETLAVAVVGVWGATRLRVPAAAINGPMTLAAALNVAGIARFALPGWLLALGYAVVGWRIGFAFTPEITRTAARAAPRVLAAIAVLMAFCGGLALLLAHVTGKDLVTAYLATSPGGADSVAIIAHSTPVDVPFVMAMQVLRFVTVLLVGPMLARRLAARGAAAPD
ncbi:MAG: AbrB family transcriptional regulator [Janthinobacterium lividum]